MVIMNRFNQLRDATEILSATAHQQTAYLTRIMKPVSKSFNDLANIDELALQFDDIASAVPDMVEKKEISTQQASCVVELNLLLGALSGEDNSDFWTAAALSSDSRWQEVRNKARDCLSILDRKTL